MPTELHAALQQHYAGDDGQIEAGFGGYRVDVLRDGVVYEIQTSRLRNIKAKLQELAEITPVVVVYPLVECKTVVRVDPETGAQLSSRRSPKRGRLSDAFMDLRDVAPILAHENVSLHVVKTVEREVRCANGKGSRRRGGVAVVNRELVEIAETLQLNAPEDYHALLPSNLPERFTVGDLAAAMGISAWHAGHVAYTLRTVGTLRQVGKLRNAYVYEAVAPRVTARRERGWQEVRCSRCDLLACEARQGSRVRWRCRGCGALEVWPARNTERAA